MSRLVGVEAKSPASSSDVRLEFDYDYLNRRVEKRVYAWDPNEGLAGDWEETPSLTRRFVWYDWLLLGELNGSNVVLKKYAWGPDLSVQSGGGPVSDRSSFAGLLSPVFAHRSGSAGAGVSPVESAGGIGGLLGCLDTQGTGTTADDAAYAFFYDANGNVGQLADLSADPNDPAGAIAAAYEYDAYGHAIATTGDYADDNPFRFSTKYWDDETGLGYWGERYYEPRRGRWVSQDPLLESSLGHLNNPARSQSV